MIFARKIKKKSRILHDFCPKSARILHNNCPRNIFPDFLGGTCPTAARPLRLYVPPSVDSSAQMLYAELAESSQLWESCLQLIKIDNRRTYLLLSGSHVHTSRYDCQTAETGGQPVMNATRHRSRSRILYQPPRRLRRASCVEPGLRPNRMVTWSIPRHVTWKGSRSWPQYVRGPLSRKGCNYRLGGTPIGNDTWDIEWSRVRWRLRRTRSQTVFTTNELFMS